MANLLKSSEDHENQLIDSMFSAGAHFGLARSRRHPSAEPYIFGAKNKVEIFDLEKTSALLEKAKAFVKSVASEGGMMLLASSKNEALSAVRESALGLDMPFVAGRWIGGTLTNFPQIRKRVNLLEDLTAKREKGELAKYTKKERLVIDREIKNLERFFSGLLPLKQKPKVLFVVDPKKEMTAVKEAKKEGIPVVAILSSDCNLSEVDYPILGNDSSKGSITFFIKEITSAYEAGRLASKKE